MTEAPSHVLPRAKKSLGQHFLRDASVCVRIVNLLECAPEDCILEIGPGPGALTKFLEQSPHARLVLLEKDNFWAAERQRASDARIQSVLIDALRFDWTRITPDLPWKIVGNLPYNVASPLIWDIVAQAHFVRATFMVQKEVGLRLAANPASKLYGALSVWVQNYTTPSLHFCIGPQAFKPKPAVDSAVLTFTPCASRPQHPEALASLLRICFQQRRKQLGGILRRAQIPNAELALEACNISPSARPEELAPLEFRALATALFVAHPKQNSPQS